jgi:hypothetical protein
VLIAAESLSIDWDGPWFKPHDHVPGKSLWLKGRDVMGGTFDELEAWCVAKGLPFVRRSAGRAGSWSAERIVFVGKGKPVRYAIDEDEIVLIDRRGVEALDGLDDVLAYFEAAEFVVPPLVVRKPGRANAIGG